MLIDVVCFNKKMFLHIYIDSVTLLFAILSTGRGYFRVQKILDDVKQLKTRNFSSNTFGKTRYFGGRIYIYK